jgi:hypothetical protein
MTGVREGGMYGGSEAAGGSIIEIVVLVHLWRV